MQKVIETESLKAWRARGGAMGAGRAAYQEDVRRQPTYNDGSARVTWGELGPIERDSWMRNPTPRDWSRRNPFLALEASLGLN